MSLSRPRLYRKATAFAVRTRPELAEAQHVQTRREPLLGTELQHVPTSVEPGNVLEQHTPTANVQHFDHTERVSASTEDLPRVSRLAESVDFGAAAAPRAAYRQGWTFRGPPSVESKARHGHLTIPPAQRTDGSRLAGWRRRGPSARRGLKSCGLAGLDIHSNGATGCRGRPSPG